MREFVILMLMVATACAQTVDVRKQTEDTPPHPQLKVGTIVPGTCPVGERFWRSDEQPGMYLCTGTNKWESVGNRIWLRDEGSGGSAPEIGEHQKRITPAGSYPKDPSGKWEIRPCLDDPKPQCLHLVTTFDITSDLMRQIKATDGVAYAFERLRYSVGILRGELFTNEEVARRVADVVRAHLGKEKGK